MSEQLIPYSGHEQRYSIQDLMANSEILFTVLHEIQQKKMLEMQEAVESIKHKISQQESFQNDQRLAIENLKTLKNKALSDDYCTRTNLGRAVIPPVSAQRMTKLLKYAGILQQISNNPYQKAFDSQLCIEYKYVNESTGYEGYNIYYHLDRTWKVIKNKLASAGLLDKFLSCTTTKTQNEFIDYLSH